VTSAYRGNVLDIEPHGPLPPQVYWRRRGLALAIALLAIALIAGAGFALFGGSKSAKDTAKSETTQMPQPENKTPVVPPAQSSTEPTPTPTSAVAPPPVLQAGDDCPDSNLAIKGVSVVLAILASPAGAIALVVGAIAGMFMYMTGAFNDLEEWGMRVGVVWEKVGAYMAAAFDSVVYDNLEAVLQDIDSRFAKWKKERRHTRMPQPLSTASLPASSLRG